MRRTLQTKVKFAGIGVHGGQHAELIVGPAKSGAGISFVRSDQPKAIQRIPALYDRVSDTRLCTKLTNDDGVSVSTVEHVMAALWGCGVTDAELSVNGPEVPIMDGSSAPFVEAFVKTGFVDNAAAPCPAIRILREVSVQQGDKFAALTPSRRFEMDFSITFDATAIGEQSHTMTLVNGAFVAELSNCRTFGQLHEADALRKLGLARGGSLQNAIVVDKGRVLNPEGLRRPDEFVRHKMLDAVGDLALAGAPIIGRYTGDRAGHGITNALLHELFKQRDAWAWEELGTGQWLGGSLPAVPSAPAVSAMAV
jgi:UDP-3-O-[3-hydroxymyristoyl] N-acetylglucosamine deacetylase